MSVLDYEFKFIHKLIQLNVTVTKQINWQKDKKKDFLFILKNCEIYMFYDIG